MTLSAIERQSLDHDGYVLLPGVMNEAWLSQLRTAFECAVGAEQTGTRHADLIASRDAALQMVPANARVAEAIRHVLGRPFHTFGFGARDPLPAFGQQGLHTDWTLRAPSEPYAVVTTLWLLDDFTGANGATRVIPGSHRNPKPLSKAMQQPLARHPDEKIVTGRAGSVLAFNGHLWHSGTKNETKLPRRVLQVQFVADDSVRRVGSPPRRASTQA